MPTRARATAAAAVLVTPLLVVPLSGSAAQAAGGPLAASIAVDWQRTAARTIYVERGSAPPLGALYLSFTSLAVHDAAREGQKHGTHAAAAAVATAAHDVLLEYFPLSGAALDADLTASLAMVPDGKKQDAGVAIGAAAADEMIASRGAAASLCPLSGCKDGRNDTSIAYTKAAALGIWPAAPMPGGMALPWLGYVDAVVDVDPVTLDGPDPYDSTAFATDYEEARTLGSNNVPPGTTSRTEEQTKVAVFFSGNPMLMYRNALCDYLDTEPLGLLPTTRLFARIDAATATTFIETWRWKYEVGFWRPDQAVDAASTPDNPGLTPHPVDWAPLVTNPAYSEYTSGHGTATSPFAEVLRQTLGDDTPLLLKAGALQRPYATLSALEHDALNARIWGGLHFRDSMEDTYYLGHSTANQVIKAIK